MTDFYDELGFEGWDNGARMGMFDKCNGRPEKKFDNVSRTVYNELYIDGYVEGYASNERKI